LADGTTLLCFPRGKKSEVACGDEVIVEQTSPGQGVISAIEARRTLLYRSDPFKQKLIAANVTQVIIVVATEPAFSDELITRCIVAAESQDIKLLIVLNKCDLSERVAAASAALVQYEKLGYRVVKLSANPRRRAAAAVSRESPQPPDRPVRDGQVNSGQCRGSPTPGQPRAKSR
jgi:ribosome biogenesis GTPase